MTIRDILISIFNNRGNVRTNKQSHNNSNRDEYFIDYDEYEKRIRKYTPYLNAHYSNLEKIEMMYSVANNLYGATSFEMEQCISLCLEDIALAPILREYWLKEDGGGELPHYSSFSRLAIIYEKRKEYDKGIEICSQSIELGFLRDNSKGGMPGRMARLVRKMRE